MLKTLVWGTLIILLGCILLLNNLQITDIDLGKIISTYWPLLLILWGVNLFTDSKNRKSRMNIYLGIVILIIGFSILLRNLGFYTADFSIIWKIIWPVILIFIGFNILRSSTATDNTGWAVMSGIEQSLTGRELTDNSYFAIMGGIDLDMKNTAVKEKETVLNLMAVMGGIEVKIPEDVNIICKNTSIMGGINFFAQESGGIIVTREFKHSGEERDKIIRIYSLSVMGGIDIK